MYGVYGKDCIAMIVYIERCGEFTELWELDKSLWIYECVIIQYILVTYVLYIFLWYYICTYQQTLTRDYNF